MVCSGAGYVDDIFSLKGMVQLVVMKLKMTIMKRKLMMTTVMMTVFIMRMKMLMQMQRKFLKGIF